MLHSQKINQIVSALVTNSILPTRNDLVAKLPPQIEGMEKEALVEALSQIYRKAVESRSIEFQDIAGKRGRHQNPEGCRMDDGQPRPLWPAPPGNHRFREDDSHVRDVWAL